MRGVPLAGGLWAMVDDEDYEEVVRFRWSRKVSARSRAIYAHCRLSDEWGWMTVTMHRMIMRTKWNPSSGLVIDHINGDGLDNRRENLRIATPSQNRCNTQWQRGRTSRYRGVVLGKNNRWFAYINHLGKRTHLGGYATEVDAALAYDAKAIELHGEFAALNFPEGVAA